MIRLRVPPALKHRGFFLLCLGQLASANTLMPIIARDILNVGVVVGTVAFGLARSFVLAWVLLAVIGAADAVSTIIRNTIRQLQTPGQLRGRMTSINQIFFQGGPQLGEMEAGAVAQLVGAPIAIITGGIGCIVGLGLIVRKWPQLMSYDGHEPAPGVPAAALPTPPE